MNGTYIQPTSNQRSCTHIDWGKTQICILELSSLEMLNLPGPCLFYTGDVGCGKTAVIRRYTHNQFIVAEPCTENKLVELTTHSVQLPGIQEVVGVVFWEIPAHSFNLVKEEQYRGSDAVIGT